MNAPLGPVRRPGKAKAKPKAKATKKKSDDMKDTKK
jgi:hypothetical protein